jgi:DNA helicase-2/ATP-dependent DNA helicase PcrA
LPPPKYLSNEALDLEPAPLAVAKYKSGQKVQHAKFGAGTVIESKITGNDEEVSVAFPDFGIKRLAASFSNLKIVD